MVGLAFTVLRAIANAVLPDRPMAVSVLSGPARGLRLMIEPQREKFYWRGRHDPAVARIMVELLKAGDVFWDVGAHIGYFALLGSRLVGPTGRVHAFEPLPANLERLRQGLDMNRTRNVEVHPVAVSDHQGEAFLSAAESSSMWSIADTGLKVQCTTLDTVLAETGPPALVKVDVEGAESRVLAGAERLLQACPAIILELWTEAANAAARALLPGWRFTPLDDHNWVARH